MITAALVKELRDKTNAGMMDCKKALQDTNGDLNAADNQELVNKLQGNGVVIKGDTDSGSIWTSVLISFLPFLLFLGLIIDFKLAPEHPVTYVGTDPFEAPGRGRHVADLRRVLVGLPDHGRDRSLAADYIGAVAVPTGHEPYQPESVFRFN